MIYQAKLSDLIRVEQDALGIKLYIGELAVLVPDILFGRLQKEVIPNLSDFVTDSSGLVDYITENWCSNCSRGICEQCDRIDPDYLPDLDREPCKSCEFVED